MEMVIAAEIRERFMRQYGTQPALYSAPGRINLIGEHTDYNDGFVLPAAVSQAVYFAVAANGQKHVRAFSVDYTEQFEFSLALPPTPEPGSWKNYIYGVVAVLATQGHTIPGFDLVFQGDIPQGSGMSSSAALECGLCFALNDLFHLGLDRITMARLAQQAEHEYAGVQCGIMDQFASLMGKEEMALMLDCRSLEYRYFPLDLQGWELLLLNSNVTHSLASSEYNVRRAQCEEGVSVLQKDFPEVVSLRDADKEMLSGVADKLPEVVYRRCKYVIEENERVQAFAEAIQTGNLPETGRILKSAQQGMAEEYEITCPEIDFMADFANKQPYVAGARMMGGGFGGCTLNLLRKGHSEQLISGLSEAYEQKFNLDLLPIKITIANGAGRL